ncbi:MAG: hypothetical protein IKU43_01685 [Clostridia bacterium]|nr:hypothetical protein [Clostridia bacterium]
MKYEDLQKVNDRLSPILIERKDKKTGQTLSKEYNTVDQRISGFRELFPDGAIVTEIVSHDNGVVLMKATAYDDNGKILATGHALEKESASYINQTSYIENCETSAIGRCLGIIGIGLTDAVASAEEIKGQIDAEQKRTDDNINGTYDELKDLYDKAGGKDFNKWVKECGGISPETYPKMKAKLLKQITDTAEKGDKK